MSGVMLTTLLLAADHVNGPTVEVMSAFWFHAVA
jgi:hypothetical protein